MLFLKSFLHDYALLPYPSETKLDYYKLLQVANQFHHILQSQQSIKYLQWEQLAQKHFGFTSQHSHIYYETYLDLSQVNGLVTIQDCTKFLLFIFNQLHNKSSNVKDVMEDEEYSAEREVEQGRELLTKFWRINAFKWLHLIYVCRYGDHTDTFADQEGALKIDSVTVNIFQFLIYSKQPSDEDQWKEQQDKFQHWVQNGDEALHSKLEEHQSIPLELYIDKLCRKFVPLSMCNSDTYPIELLDSLVSWSLCVEPNCTEIDQGGIHSFSQPAMFNNKRHETIVITNATELQIYRCHNCFIFILCPIRKLMISYSRSTQVFVGFSQLIRIHYCDQMTVRGIASTVLVSQCQQATLKLFTKSLNLIESDCGLFCSNQKMEIVAGNKSLVIGPCDQWYQGMKEDLMEFNVDLSKFTWDSLQCVWNDHSKVVSFVADEDYLLMELPFELNGTAECPFKVPTEFQSRQQIYDLFLKTVQLERPLNPTFQDQMYESFKEWLDAKDQSLMVSLLRL